ncbi:MAG: penicillin acylase family protein [Pseudomonadota bacterium]
MSIHWDAYKIPFIEAETDYDAAVALGLVHAHLRLGQMEFGKRVVSGRIAEMAGPPATQIDAAVRAIGLRRAVPEILDMLPAETRAWIEGFTLGVNHYKAHVAPLPHDFAALGLDNEPWTAADTIALGRLAAADLNWTALFSLLPQRTEPGWPALWHRFGEAQGALAPSIAAVPPATPTRAETAPDEGWREMIALFAPFARAGSNSFAVSGARSATGAALIANDPHLALTVPNLWLVAGVKAPSLHAVGMMPAGIPAFVLGRNEHLAWGATNMRHWATDFVDVTGQGGFTVERHHLERRGLWPTTVENRVSRWGPIVSDAPLLPFPEDRDIAMRWLGHLPSNELTALLDVARAETGADILRAVEGYAVPGQNIVFAEADGDIGMILTTATPSRPTGWPDDIIVSPEESDRAWERVLGPRDLPQSLGGEVDVIASANNKPVADAPTRLGWFFPRDDRVRRIYQLLGAKERLDLDDLRAVQLDTYAITEHGLVRALLTDALALGPEATRVATALSAWDGHFETDSNGAVLYQAFLADLAPALYAALDRAGEERWHRESGQLPLEVARELSGLPSDRALDLIEGALEAAAPFLDDGTRWGDIHRIDVGYLLTRAPLIGARYRLDEIAVRGGQETVAKSAGPLTTEPHQVAFGVQSRHLSDLSDPNANYFVLFGGQDGFINAENFADQTTLWAAGDTIQVPLEIAEVRRRFSHTTDFAGTGPTRQDSHLIQP